MDPRPFDYVAPVSLGEAVLALDGVAEAKVLSGGMSLIPMMKLRLVSPELVVDIERIPGLDAIDVGEGTASIGALVRHSSVAIDATLIERAAALAEAARWTGDTQVRNRGTLCGVAAHADGSGDQSASLLALGAMVAATSNRGERLIHARDLFVDAFTTVLQADEIITGVTVPLSRTGEGSAYTKVGRRGGSHGYPIAGAAAWVATTSDGSVVDARVALTGVGTIPLLVDPVAETLIGTDGSPEAIRRAGSLAADTPIIPDLHGSRAYKAHLVTVVTGRAVSNALCRARSSWTPGPVD